MTKYLILDADNQIVGWSNDSSIVSQAQTNSNIPSYDIKIQSIFWENGSIVVKDDDVKIKNESEKPMRLLRQERNRRLAETDWWAMKEVDGWQMSPQQRVYRKNLRDMPETSPYPMLNENGVLTNVDWPEKP